MGEFGIKLVVAFLLFQYIQYMKGAYKEAGEGLFVTGCSDRIRHNGFKLKAGRFR